MARFRKIICRPRVYRVDTPKGRQITPITEKLIRSVAQTANEMLKAGLKIPSPFAHKDGNKIVPGPLVEKEGNEVDAQTLEAPTWNSSLNAGFWEKFEVDNRGNLVGILDVPGSEEDLSTNAGKISKTIKETSVYLVPEFVDGLGRTWKNALRHVAVVNNAIEPDQTNFELIPDTETYALAMAFSMSDEVGYSDDKPSESSPKPPKDTTDSEGEDTTTDTTTDETSSSTANIPEIVSLIKDKLGYEMPTDTDDKNFLDRLRTILVSIKQDAEPDEELKDLEKKPKEAETESPTTIMADETNPDNVVWITKINKLVKAQVEKLQQEFNTRIQALIASGRISKKHAQTTLLPAVGELSMSHEDLDAEGNFPKTHIEMALELLEEKDSLLDTKLEDKINGTVEDYDDEIPSMTDKERDALYAQIL